MKQIAVLGIAVSALLLATGCVRIHGADDASKRQTPVKAARTASSDASARGEGARGHRTVNFQSDIGPVYTSVDEFIESPYLDVIIRGKVLDTANIYSHENAWTKCTVRVLKSWSPSVSVGDVITVVDYGGIASLADLKRDAQAGDLDDPDNLKRDPDEPRNNSIAASDETSEVVLSYAGEPLATAGSEAIYFLSEETKMQLVPGTFYVPLGAYQGKFIINQGVARRHVPRDQGQPAAQIDSVEVALFEGSISRAIANATPDK